MKDMDEKIDYTWLAELLEEEKHAGIPPIPERLKPEQIETVLEETINNDFRKKKSFKLVANGLIAAAACVVIMLTFQTKSKNTMEIMTETYVEDSGGAYSSGQTANITSEETGYVPMDGIQKKEIEEESGLDKKEEIMEESDVDSETVLWKGEEKRRVHRPQGFPREYIK